MKRKRQLQIEDVKVIECQKCTTLLHVKESKTVKNPNRFFFSHNKCNFFQWRDQIQNHPLLDLDKKLINSNNCWNVFHETLHLVMPFLPIRYVIRTAFVDTRAYSILLDPNQRLRTQERGMWKELTRRLHTHLEFTPIISEPPDVKFAYLLHKYWKRTYLKEKIKSIYIYMPDHIHVPCEKCSISYMPIHHNIATVFHENNISSHLFISEATIRKANTSRHIPIPGEALDVLEQFRQALRNPIEHG